MTVLVTGATGFIGGAFCRGVQEPLVLLSRNVEKSQRLFPDAKVFFWDGHSPVPAESLDGVDTVLHLMGEPVIGRRWSPQLKDRILSSRVESTRHIVDAMAAQSDRPKTFLCASAVGIYGDRGEEELDESSPLGEDFLAEVCKQWENAADRAASLGVRTVHIRIGLVLGAKGGAFKQMLLPFRWGLGGKLGNGRAYFPWIHLDDLLGIIRFARENAAIQGPINGVAPHHDTNLDFTKTLGKHLRRPTFFTVPKFAMNIVLGEATQVMFASQRVFPKKALDGGYEFVHADLDSAIPACLEET